MADETWHTMIVRAWRDRDGLKIRFMTDDPDPLSATVAVEATVESATSRFADWLHAVAAPGAEDHDPGHVDNAG